jgi:hypothetical protein
VPASAQCAGTLAGRCSGRSDPQPRAGQRTMPGVLPNERLLPTPFKPVSTNLHVRLPPSVRHQTAIRCLPYPSTTTAVWCSATSQDQQEGGGHLLLQAFAPKRCTQHWHPTIYKQHPLQKGGVPRLRSVHADWGCPTTDPPNGVCTLVVAASCSSVCIAVCCCAFDFEFWNLNESADTPS